MVRRKKNRETRLRQLAKELAWVAGKLSEIEEHMEQTGSELLPLAQYARKRAYRAFVLTVMALQRTQRT